jgi:Ca-activated chloride channel family protein
VDLVLVPVTVVDAGNHAITGLKKEDFTLLDGGQPQQIRSFFSEDAPLSIGIVLDCSKSMKNKVEKVRESLLTFLQTANRKDEFFMITFSDRPALAASFTRSPEAVASKLVDTEPDGHTALLDAIYMAMAQMRRARYSRKALLILSDGGDNRSRYTASEIKDLVQESDVQLYAIGIFDTIFTTPEEARGKQLLREVTETTGGHTFALRNLRDLPAVVSEISLELRSQYVLGFRPSDPAAESRWRKIKVRLNTRHEPPFHVFARAGYYPPAD